MRRQRVARDLMRRLGHPVRLDDGHLKNRLQLRHELWGQWRRRGADEAERLGTWWSLARLDTSQNGIVHRGNGRVPGRPKLGEPGEETGTAEIRRDRHRPRCAQRRQQSGDKPVNVKERHDVQAAIARAQPEGHRNVRGGRPQIPVCQGHSLWLRCRTRGVQDKRDVIAMRVFRGAGKTPLGCQQRKTTGPTVQAGTQLDNVDPAFSGGCGCGRIDDRGDDQRLGFQVAEVEVEFAFAVRGIERNSRRNARDCEECRCQLGTSWKNQCNPMTPGDSTRLERFDRCIDLVEQLTIRERRALG